MNLDLMRIFYKYFFVLKIVILTFLISFKSYASGEETLSINDSSQMINQSIQKTGSDSLIIDYDISAETSKIYNHRVSVESGDLEININSGDFVSNFIEASDGILKININSEDSRLFSQQTPLSNIGAWGAGINLGTHEDSEVNLNNGVLSARIKFGHEEQDFNILGGQFYGLVSGPGNIYVGDDQTADLWIYRVGTKSLNSLTINKNSNVSINNDVIISKLLIGKGSELSFNRTFLIPEIDGLESYSGTININQHYFNGDSEYSIGTVNGLETINLGVGKTLIFSGKIKTKDFNVGSELGISNLYLNSNFENTNEYQFEGNINLYHNTTLNIIGTDLNILGDITSNGDLLSSITISQSGQPDQIFETKIKGNIGSASKRIKTIDLEGKRILNLESGNVYFGNLKIDEGTLKLGDINLFGNIDLNKDDSASLEVYGKTTLNQNLGDQEKKFKEVRISGENGYLDVNNNDIEASRFIIGENSTLKLTSGNINSEEIIFEEDSNLHIYETANLNNGQDDFYLNSNTIKFFNDGSSISKNIIGDGSSIIDVQGYQARINGDLTLLDGDIFSVYIPNIDNSGKLTVSGNANISEDVGLNVKVTARDFYEIREKGFVILEAQGDSSSISEIKTNNINVNNSGSNEVGLISVSTSSSDNQLNLQISFNENGVDEEYQRELEEINQRREEENQEWENNNSQKRNRNEYPNVSKDRNLQGIFEKVNDIGSKSRNELSDLQDYLLVTNITNSQREEALRSVIPNDLGLNNNAFESISGGLNSVQNRIDFVRSTSLDKDSKDYKIVNKESQELANIDDSNLYAQNRGFYATDGFYNNNDLTKSIWAQIIGSTARQGNQEGFSGYESTAYGLSFGFDHKLDKSSLAGVSMTISESEIDSSDNLKSNDIQSYQLTIYGEKLFNNKLFLDGFASSALNRYDSTRSMPAVNRIARARFNGQTHSARIRTGYIHRFNNGFELFPEISLSYAHNSIEDYQESGAGAVNLEVQTRDSQMLESEIGFGFGKKFRLAKSKYIPSFTFDPKLRLSYGYDFIGNSQISNSNFVGQNVSFVTETSRINRSVFRGNFGFNLYSSDDFVISANYIQERRKLFKSHSGIFKVKWGF